MARQQNNKPAMPPIPSAKAPVSPVPVVTPVATGSEALTPGVDADPSGLAGNPHVHDPAAIRTEEDRKILEQFQDLSAPTHSSSTGAYEEDEEGEAVTNDGASGVKIPTKKGPFEVVATRAGFYKQERREENEPFTIDRFDEFGEWMRAVDPDVEKARAKFFKEKNDRISRIAQKKRAKAEAEADE